MRFAGSSSKVFRALLWVLVFCVAMALAALLARNDLVPFFMTRPSLNGVIGLLLAIGAGLSFFHLGRLLGQARSMDLLATRLGELPAQQNIGIERAIDTLRPGLVTDRCIRTLKAIRQGGPHGPEALSLLSDADVESEEGRGIVVRYLLGVMVFLGLMGTFWGVLISVSGVQKVLQSLEPERIADAVQFIVQLKESMGGLLGGMSTAFSTSLFGLGGSVILGFIDAQTRRARSAVLADLDRFIVTIFLPAATGYEPSLTRGAGAQAIESRPEELHVLATQQALAENLRALTEVITQQSAADEKVSDSLVEIKGMLESLHQEERVTQENVRVANQMRQGMLERMDNLMHHLERLVKETRLSRDGAEASGRALLDRLKLEGEITNKTLSMGFSDLKRKLDPEGARSTTRKDSGEDGG